MFEDKLGLIKEATAKIYVDSNAQPRYCRARKVLYAPQNKIEQELEHLENDGIIEPVQFADWAAPIVPVMKPDRSVPIPGDTVFLTEALQNLPVTAQLKSKPGPIKTHIYTKYITWYCKGGHNTAKIKK